MSIATVVTRGYVTGNAQFVVVRGYGDYGGAVVASIKDKYRGFIVNCGRMMKK